MNTDQLKFQKSNSRRTTLWLLAAMASTTLLTACGGGGGDNGPCGGTGNLNLDLTYEVNGQLVDARTVVILTRNAPVTATPRVLGLPEACAGAVRWTARARTAVPAGISFDAATGVFTGAPTARATFSVDLTVTVDGYTANVRRTVDFFM